MYPPFPTEMDLVLPTASSRKRPADDSFLTPDVYEPPPVRDDDDNVPCIVRRHQHRRRNLAAPQWGPYDVGNDDPPPAPNPIALPPLVPATTAKAVPQRFNVYKAILRHPNLFFQFALRLPYDTIMNLYAIDKEFHYRLNKFSVSLIHDYAKYHVPIAGFIFSWTLYPSICISDPMLRPMDGREWLARDVPGFRWLAMVFSRQKIVQSILTRLAMEGHRVPAACMAVVMKYWVVMEMNTTKMRKAMISDPKVWSDNDIILFQLFLVKLDMRLTDVILGNGICELSRLLLTQRSLVPLWKVLTGRMKLDYESVSDMVLHTYPQADLVVMGNQWLEDDVENMPQHMIGALSAEEWDWDENRTRMDSAVNMLIEEGVRRGLHIQQHYLDFVMYGFVDDETWKNIPIPRKYRRDWDTVALPKEGYPTVEEKKSVLERLDEGAMVDLKEKGKGKGKGKEKLVVLDEDMMDTSD